VIELQDVCRQYGEAYRLRHPQPLHVLKVMQAITHCRTAAMGGHLDACDTCDFTRISYNSCRNRHCPKCQTVNKERWIEARKADLLNVGYFHVVFTLPDLLNPIAYHNPHILYDLLFKAAAETLTELAADKKYLGAQIGFTSILHTWGQNLMHHPHLHVVVPGGGLNAQGKWIPSKKKFFIPVKVLSRKFRGKFLADLKHAELQFFGTTADLQHPASFQRLLTSLYQKEWVVYCKPPFKNAGCVVEYLGRYTHRVAISNSRIMKLDDDRVTFKWRDYKDANQPKEMTVAADEFIRRFLIHVLPPGFTRIRHYGFLSPRNKATRLQLCKKLTRTPVSALPETKRTTLELLQQILGKDFACCPCCRVGHMSRAAPAEQTA
jgi:hypothetical protein